MIKIPYEQILERIQAKENISHEEIEKRIQAKMEQLSGLISKEGAAHILANELGIALAKAPEEIKIKDVLPGMRVATLAGKITRKYDVREFQSGERQGKVGSFMIGDETGSIRVTCWNDKTALMENLKEEDIVQIKESTVRENRGFKELHTNDKTEIVQNPEGVTVGEVKAAPTSAPAVRKQISQLQENTNNVELLGTIVQVFDIKFFERCPQCRKRVREQEGVFACAQHGAVNQEYGYVTNVYLDDGTGNIRTVFFGNQIQQLLNKPDQEIQLMRTNPQAYESVKTELLGEMIKVQGRTTKNQMFDRIEFVANIVNRNVNPDEEIARLKAELEKP